MKRVGLVVVVLLAGTAWGQVDPHAAALLAKMRAAYGSLKTARTVGHAKLVGRTKTLLASSTVEFRAPLNFRIETTGVPGTAKPAYLCVTDGKKIHTEGLPGGPETKPYTYDGLLADLPQTNLETICFFDWHKQLSTAADGNMHQSTFRVYKERWMNREWTVLEETPQTPPEVVKYYVDPATNLIWRTALFRKEQKEPFTDIWFTKLEVNSKLDPKAFAIP
jgi:hypothetical protein